MSRRLIRLVALLLTIWGLPALSSSAENLNFGTAFKGAPNYDLPMWAAEEKGFWDRQGLIVTWFPFRGTAEMTRAAAAGSVDISYGDPTGVILAISGGAPVIIVADAQAPAGFYVYTLADSRIRQPTDLKGARVGVARFGGAEHNYGRVIAKAVGLEKEVNFVAIGGMPAKMAALKARGTDVLLSGYQSAANFVARGEIRAVASVSDFLPKDWLENVVSAHNRLIKDKPELVKRGLKGLFQSISFIQSNRNWAVEKMKINYGYPEGAARLISEQIFPGEAKIIINPKALENVMNFLAQYNILAKDRIPPLNKVYTARFTE